MKIKGRLFEIKENLNKNIGQSQWTQEDQWKIKGRLFEIKENLNENIGQSQ